MLRGAITQLNREVARSAAFGNSLGHSRGEGFSADGVAGHLFRLGSMRGARSAGAPNSFKSLKQGMMRS
jgi:hypothetical protein